MVLALVHNRFRKHGLCGVKITSKEVGWDDVYLESEIIPNIPSRLKALHWHEDMFQIPQQAELLFSGNHIRNQGFIINHHVIGLQFHLSLVRERNGTK